MIMDIPSRGLEIEWCGNLMETCKNIYIKIYTQISTPLNRKAPGGDIHDH